MSFAACSKGGALFQGREALVWGEESLSVGAHEGLLVVKCVGDHHVELFLGDRPVVVVIEDPKDGCCTTCQCSSDGKGTDSSKKGTVLEEQARLSLRSYL